MKADGTSPRLVDAYGRFLERNGRAADATALYTKAAGTSALAPLASAGLARIAKKDKPDALVRGPQDGVAEALFGIAASLTEDASADVGHSRSQASGSICGLISISEISWLGDRMETLQKTEDAIEAYRKIDKDSPYYRLAAIQIASDEAKLDKTDDSIRDLKKLAEANPNDIEAWTALGDTYRVANRFSDAVTAYDSAIKAVGTASGKRHWPLPYARAISEDRAHNWAGAEADLQEALKLSPDGAADAELSGLQLGRSEPQHSPKRSRCSSGHAR